MLGYVVLWFEPLPGNLLQRTPFEGLEAQTLDITLWGRGRLYRQFRVGALEVIRASRFEPDIANSEVRRSVDVATTHVAEF